ncbi:YhjD/YihY/BrkB family envelope integrity protein [Pelotalea chapellei]|uniref:YihY family inner membrane protein n=1 Tax=Pelotalea chapellei TaxID=44671 RepID=A0ABS5UBB4_9BACT|nr:YhjD/YihY/BrkB family envelope integrity protein [Pelotalea chapellei]MBT1072972.1 YihY family inner membrane protein [Pelotalea chapellei]
MKGRVFRFLQTAYQIGVAFYAHQGFLRASALTYTTVLSLVPLLAIAFSVLKGFGVQNALEPLLQQVAGDSEETISRIITYVDNTNVRSIGTVGLLMLVLSVISLLGTIEEAFNATWGVPENRSLQRRFSDYLSVVVIGPMLLLAATSMNSSLQSQWLVKWLIENTYLAGTILLLFRMAPYLFIWVAMTFLYIFIPNTKVQLRSAIVGGVLAGTAWQIAQWGYFYFQIGMTNYNAIYGTLAAVPIFLVWVYISWLIVLFGLEVAYAHQHRAVCTRHPGTGVRTDTTRDMLALSVLLLVCKRFYTGAPPPAALQLSDELGIPLNEVEELLETLQKLHYLVKVRGDRAGWLPAREPSFMMLDEVLVALRGKLPPTEEFVAACGPAIDLLARESGMRRETFKGFTIGDMMKETSQPSPGSIKETEVQ